VEQMWAATPQLLAVVARLAVEEQAGVVAAVAGGATKVAVVPEVGASRALALAHLAKAGTVTRRAAPRRNLVTMERKARLVRVGQQERTYTRWRR